MKMIVESNYNVNIERDSKKNLYIEGLFALSETENENSRIYPKELLEREIEKIKNGPIANNSCLGELEHPTQRSQTILERAAIMVDKVEWKGNEVYGRAKVLENVPAGYTLKGLLESGVRVGISSRGLGETRYDEERQVEIVTETYNLLCWDCVQSPSTPGAFVRGILEGKEFNVPKDTIQEPQVYNEIKQILLDNSLPFNPMKIKELVEQKYDAEYIKDMIVEAQKHHEKQIWQVLENIKKNS